MNADECAAACSLDENRTGRLGRSQCRIFQRLLTRASRYKLCVVRSFVRSLIHRSGVRAGENIPAGRRVIEDAGERIGRAEARRRFL